MTSTGAAVQAPATAITATEIPNKISTLGPTLSPNAPLSSGTRSPTSPGHSLWFTKTIGISDSGDPYLADHANSLPVEELITWKLFKRVSQADTKMSHEVYISFAQRLSDRREIEKAVMVVQASPQNSWNLETYKLLIYLLLNKRPKDVDGAQKLLAQYGSSSVQVSHVGMMFAGLILVRRSQYPRFPRPMYDTLIWRTMLPLPRPSSPRRSLPNDLMEQLVLKCVLLVSRSVMFSGSTSPAW